MPPHEPPYQDRNTKEEGEEAYAKADASGPT